MVNRPLQLDALGTATLTCPELGHVKLPQQRMALLTYLALAGPDPVPRERLIGFFWPGVDPERARHSLSNALYGIRRCVGQDTVQVAGQSVWLDRSRVDVDVLRFEEAFDTEAWDRAVETYGGPLLDGLSARYSADFEHWLGGRRFELGHAYGEAAREAAVAAEKAGDLGSAVRKWRRLTMHDPHNSRYAAGLIRVLWRTGDAEEALLYARKHERRLARELGIRPHPMMAALVRQIRSSEHAHRPSDVAARSPVATGGTGSRGRTTEGTGPSGTPGRDLRSLVRGHAVWAIAAAAVLAVSLSQGVGSAGTEPVRIVLADLDAAAGDAAVARSVTQSLREALRVDERIDLVPPDRVRAALRRMRLDPDGGLPSGVARELAVREGAGAVLTAELRATGGDYLVLTRIVDPGSGNVISDAARRHVVRASTAGGRDSERMAESVRSAIVAVADKLQPTESLPRVTTSSLVALRLYARANRAARSGSNADAADLLEQAVRLDSVFASAHLGLGILRRRMNQRTLAREAIAVAHRLIDDLPPRERARVSAEYRLLVDGELTGAIEAFESFVDNRWDNAFIHHTIADARSWLGQWDLAAGHLESAIGADSTFFEGWADLAQARWETGDSVAARAIIRTMRGRFSGDQRMLPIEGAFAHTEGRSSDALEAALEQLAGAQHGTSTQADALFAAGVHALATGRIESGLQYLESACDVTWTLGRRGASIALATVAAFGLLRTTGDADRSRQWLESLTAKYPLDSVPELDRPYLNLAVLHAALGRTERARSLFAEHHRRIDPEFLQFEQAPIEEYTSAVLHVAEGGYETGIQHLRKAHARQRCKRCMLPMFAEVARLQGRFDREAELLEAYLATPHWSMLTESLPAQGGEPFWVATALERLAEAYAGAGLISSGAACDRRLVELWKDADPELQHRVRAAHERLRAAAREALPGAVPQRCGSVALPPAEFDPGPVARVGAGAGRYARH